MGACLPSREDGAPTSRPAIATRVPCRVRIASAANCMRGCNPGRLSGWRGHRLKRKLHAVLRRHRAKRTVRVAGRRVRADPGQRVRCGADAATSGRSRSSRRGPMPRTASSSSGSRNGPCSRRCCTILAASTGRCPAGRRARARRPCSGRAGLPAPRPRRSPGPPRGAPGPGRATARPPRTTPRGGRDGRATGPRPPRSPAAAPRAWRRGAPTA